MTCISISAIVDEVKARLSNYVLEKYKGRNYLS